MNSSVIIGGGVTGLAAGFLQIISNARSQRVGPHVHWREVV